MAKRVDKDSKRKEIITAAARVFAQDGFARAKMADIAIAADIGKGTIYEYFQSKDELFLAMCQHLVRWPQDVSPFTVYPRQGLRDLIDAIVDSYERATDFFSVLIDYWSIIIRENNAHGALFLSQGENFYDQPRRLLSAVIVAGQNDGSFREDLDPEKTGQVIIAGIEGLRIQRTLDSRHVDLQADIGLFTELMLTAVCR